MAQTSSGARTRVSVRGAVAAALAAALAGCSGHAGAPQQAAGASGGFDAAVCASGQSCPTDRATPALSPSASPQAADSAGSFAAQPAVGVAITDPAYVPVVQQPISATAPAVVVGHPALQMLPAGWNTTSWIGSVVRFAGQAEASAPNSDPGASETWSKTTAQVDQGLTVFAALRGPGSPTMIQCSAGGFDPADAAAHTQALAVLSLCADADFPGSEPAVAQPWVARQADILFKDLTTMTAGQHVMCATPIFGAGVYEMSARELGAGNPIITLNVYGSGQP